MMVPSESQRMWLGHMISSHNLILSLRLENETSSPKSKGYKRITSLNFFIKKRKSSLFSVKYCGVRKKKKT